ncbi:MAG TPA: methyltransferase domain-containing protein [Bryobacteraceae bacterium]|nr:methyltransferase domain-containing protein [Bryobacteraceae bacterium]
MCVRQNIPPASNWSALDVGCGRGEYTLWMSRLPRAAGAVGLDEMEGDAAGAFFPTGRKDAPKITLIKGLFHADAIRDRLPFHLLLCVDVLEHILDDETFLRDLARCGAPRARLILHVPARSQWHPLPSAKEELDRQLLPGVGQHVREGYSAGELRARLAANGWTVEKTGATFGRAAALLCDLDYALSLRGPIWRPVRAFFIPLAIAIALYESVVTPASGNGWLVVSSLDKPVLQ